MLTTRIFLFILFISCIVTDNTGKQSAVNQAILKVLSEQSDFKTLKDSQKFLLIKSIFFGLKHDTGANKLHKEENIKKFNVQTSN
jgi:hypothetical protein